MASETVRAVLDHVWSALQPLGHPCALIGGLALAVWNYPRATRDVDLLIAVDSMHAEPVIQQLLSCGCRAKNPPPLRRVGTHHFAQFLYTPPGEFYDVQFDLMLAESEFEKSALSRCVERNVPGLNHPIDVLHCDDLVLMKLIAGRLIDRADAAMLLRENRDAIDFGHLRSWAGRLDLMSELITVWDEAFHGEELPEAG